MNWRGLLFCILLGTIAGTASAEFAHETEALFVAAVNAEKGRRFQ